jgi:hypothetical protein
MHRVGPSSMTLYFSSNKDILVKFVGSEKLHHYPSYQKESKFDFSVSESISSAIPPCLVSMAYTANKSAGI